MRKHLLIGLGLFALSATVVAGVTWPWGDETDRSGYRTEAAPVIYRSFEDAQNQHDATLAVTVVSRDGTYVDDGGDGKPDFPGDPGLPMEYLTVLVDDVLKGDELLVGSELTVVQSERGTMSETTAEEHMVPGNAYVIIASEYESNPGTLEGKAWATPLAGQGVFPLIDGDVVPTRSDVFPETFNHGSIPLAALDQD